MNDTTTCPHCGKGLEAAYRVCPHCLLKLTPKDAAAETEADRAFKLFFGYTGRLSAQAVTTHFAEIQDKEPFIRMCQEVTGWSLPMAQNFVEIGQVEPVRRPRLRCSGKSGCLGLLVVGLAAASGLLLLL